MTDLLDAFAKIASLYIDFAIGLSAIILAVGIVTGFVGGQFMVTVGQPYGLSGAWMKVLSLIILAVGAMLTILIVNTVIGAMQALIPPTVIPIPKPGGMLFLHMRG